MNKEDKHVLYIPTDFNQRDSFLEHAYSKEKGRRRTRLMEEQNLSINEYFNQISILEVLLTSWEERNVYPTSDQLLEIYETVKFEGTTLRQDIFVYFSTFIRESELDDLTDKNDSPIFFNFLLELIARHKNTRDSIVGNLNVKHVRLLRFGNKLWYKPFSKYIISELELKKKSRWIKGIYCFVRDSEGEGLEIFLPVDNNESAMIKHYESGASLRSREVLNTLKKVNDADSSM